MTDRSLEGRQRATVMVLALCALSLAACKTDGPEISSTFDPLAAFPRHATFRWDERANKLPEDPRVEALELGPIIRAAAEEQFAARGYRLVTSGAAHYRLSYELAVTTRISADGSRSVGSLSLLLSEEGTGRRVWLGFGRAPITVALTPEERRERLGEALARMLESFPPNQPRS